jgi:hypothetical protein
MRGLRAGSAPESLSAGYRHSGGQWPVPGGGFDLQPGERLENALLLGGIVQAAQRTGKLIECRKRDVFTHGHDRYDAVFFRSSGTIAMPWAIACWQLSIFTGWPSI